MIPLVDFTVVVPGFEVTGADGGSIGMANANANANANS